MADAVKIEAEARDPAKNKGTGSRVSRRLRAQGRIPAIIYGHKQGNVPISIPRESVWEMIKKSTHLAELKVGSATETVLVREVQWDYLGKEIIHLDFARVNVDEAVETEIGLDFRGTAPGVAEGGVLEIVLHQLRVKSRADAIPEVLKVDLSDLHLDQGLHVKDLKLPEGVTADADPELLLAHVVTRGGATTEDAEEGTASQPEVIKSERKEKEE